MPFFLDTGLNHPYIRDYRGMCIQRSKGCRDGIIIETQEVCHSEISDSNRTPLPDPVLDRIIADNRPGKGAGFLRDRVAFLRIRTGINIRTCGGIPAV
jgi:hypothetical protein